MEDATRSAIRDYREALLIIEALVEADPDDFDLKVYHARILRRLGGALAQTDDRSEARRRLESARDLYETLRAAQPETVELHKGLEETLNMLSGLAAGTAAGEAGPGP